VSAEQGWREYGFHSINLVDRNARYRPGEAKRGKENAPGLLPVCDLVYHCLCPVANLESTVNFRRYTIAALSFLVLASAANAFDSKRDALWAAVRAGDVKAAKEAVENGADVAAGTSMA